ncbi:MAG TPA: type II toxin-antitoxin system VapC family toxin [Candidatus Limnocylindria bacterium]|nr:type II toxin-antitoxin system VapC family toxin [Candidatus Limnocylindria bacterium]
MILPDVNVLVYAHREDAPGHPEHLAWLKQTLDSDAPYGFSELVLSGFIRVVTHPRVFTVPTPIAKALQFAGEVRQRPNAVPISAGPRHWAIFARLCGSTAVRGNLVPDAYLAALAIESGSEWITTDRDYARFPGLKWRHPLGDR